MDGWMDGWMDGMHGSMEQAHQGENLHYGSR
jgi:hypothetical protein